MMLPKEEKCTGCGACANSCPVKAIKMQHSSTGFLVPVIEKECINCGKCEKICPVLHKREANTLTPKFYSFCASDAIRQVSSSGGIFSLIAQHVLNKNGYVCGAAFDENMKLKHRIIHTKEELPALRGSKYLQCDTGDSFTKVKELLIKDEYVLFTGTPCQVAGLYAYLGKDYEKLVTAELLCHGVPSQKFFDSYLEDISQGKKVKNVSFRSKRIGWNFNAIITTFEDGTEHVGYRFSRKNPDPYANAFMLNMSVRKSCFNCSFSTYPRQGDFTIGDLWHSEKLDPASNDRKGTSFVFLNNAKAEGIFADISKDAKYYKEIEVADYSKIPNRVTPKAKEHPNRRRFLNLLKRKTFTEAYTYTNTEKYDIGMLGYMYAANVGSVLTYYALYHVLMNMGYEVLPIERPKDAPLPISQQGVDFFAKWLPAYAQPVQYNSIIDMRQLNDKCDKFIVGSDQVWLQTSSEPRNNFCFGQWINDNKTKVSFATSFGGQGGRGTEKYYSELKYYLNKFTANSCRENDGVNFANNQLKLNKKVALCFDPVFLANKDIYLRLIKSVKVDRKEDYIGSYILRPRQAIFDLIDKTKKNMSINSVEVIGEEKIKDVVSSRGYDYKSNFPIEETLERIYNSKFFVTDSYHGVCFCIILKKDFLVIPRDFPDRFTTLLDKLGLSNRLIKENHANWSEKLYAPIDWKSVDEKLSVEVGISRHWLKNALEENIKDKELTDKDILMDFIRKQTEEIGRLKEEIELIKNNRG